MNLFKLFFLLLLPLFVYSQEPTGDAKTAEPTKEPATDSKPLKHESGSVSMDPRAISINYKNNNLIILKRLKVSLLNYEMEEDYKKLMKSYIDATILLQERKYPEARRAFEGNATELNEAAQKLFEKNKEVHDKLLKNTSEQIIEMKIDAEPGDTLVSILEKNIAQATDISLSANESISTKNYIEALEKLKRSNYTLLRIIASISKNKNKTLKIADRVQKKLLIDEDYIPTEYIKLYDDSRNLIFQEEEEERRKEREKTLKNISSRYGDMGLPDTNTVEPKTSPEDKPVDADTKKEEK